MAKFRCNVSGNVVEFHYEVDIVTTRENPAYTEVIEEVKTEKEEVKKSTPKKSTKED